MSRFSDSNYKLLYDYFNVLVAERTGTGKSYLVGPGHTIVSQGGLYSILYEDHPERGFVGHRFKIKEIDGNRFKMTYEGLESNFQIATLDSTTTSAELSAFGIGNEMYFRKDSFFHYWLARSTQDDLYHDFINQKKTFLFFGKIWPVSNETNTYAIEFNGMKDFTLQALPQTNQTVNMTEWLKIYWDQVNHEIYNMTKNFWSLLDAREVDIRWLGYIADIYGVQISEEVLNELSLREWVENLPYFLKRVGTYNALYIIWKIFLSNTKNTLNVYERWGEWCVQNSSDLKDSFEDYHFLEFYGTQPSGGAGNHFYSNFDPSNYPTHTLTSPSGDCTTFKWDNSNKENYLLFHHKNLNCSIGDVKENEINVTGYDPTSTATKVIFLSGGIYSGDFVHSTGVEMYSSLTQPSNIVFWALSNEVNQMSDHSGDYISASFEVSGGSLYFKLVEYEAGVPSSVKSTYAYSYDVPYYLVIDRTGTTLRARVYDNSRLWVEDLLETINLSLSDADSYSILYAVNGRRITGHNEWYGKIYGVSIDNDFVEANKNSGYKVITPHYKVQVDLSIEPLGDIFDDQTIISENLIDELVANFELVRPVSKFSHYEELIAPSGAIDRTGSSIPLYPLTSNGYLNTLFTGSKFISAGGDGLGVDSTYVHFQDYMSKTWNVNHDLNTNYVLVQAWKFGSDNSQEATLIMPDSIELIDQSNVQLVFGESVRGIATLASSGASGVGFIDQDNLSVPSLTWNINHNLSTNTPSGYSSTPGPVINHWNNSNKMITPDINDLIGAGSPPTTDLTITTWAISASGSSITRRSDYLHYQDSSSDTWSINHKLNSWVIVQCYEITTNEEIVPKKVVATDRNNLNIYWESGKRGYAHIIQIGRDNVVYSTYDCDTTGLGICIDGVGYWKIGTGTSSLWNPFIQNDLESPSTSGSYYLIEEDSNNVYIDFIVPSDFEDINITEVGLFNYLDELILYSQTSGLYKPEGVQCRFHYRVKKL